MSGNHHRDLMDLFFRPQKKNQLLNSIEKYITLKKLNGVNLTK